MMITLNALTASLYLFSCLGFFLQVIFSEKRLGNIAFGLLGGALVSHTVLVGIHLSHNGYPFILGDGDFYYFASWIVGLVAFIFMALRSRHRLSGLGVFFTPLVLLLFIIAEVRRKDFYFGIGVVQNPWALVHLLFMMLAFAIFAVSFLIGCIYLLEQSQLKNRHPSRFIDWLPSLGMIDLIHYRALTIGFSLLSIGILSGAALSKTTEGSFFTGDPRQFAALGTWLLYAFFLNVHLKPRWRGRKGIILSLLGFLGVVLAFVGLEHRL